MFKNKKIKIFADGANIEDIIELNKLDYVSGFTTNPSLMKKAGINDYKSFALEVVKFVKDKPISFEVFADDLKEIEEQALIINEWGKNINVKIPVTNTRGVSTADIISRLSDKGVFFNVTAIFNLSQIKEILKELKNDKKVILSVFAGRIADTGVDPEPVMSEIVNYSKSHKKAEILWASPRELINIYQADKIGCHIITVQKEIINKIKLIGKDLNTYSLETIKMFYKDATEAGFKIVR